MRWFDFCCAIQSETVVIDCCAVPPSTDELRPLSTSFVELERPVEWQQSDPDVTHRPR